MTKHQRLLPRRRVLAAAVSAGSALLVGCGGTPARRRSTVGDEPKLPASVVTLEAASSPPGPTPTPTAAVVPAGVEERLLLPETPWETGLSIANSGAPGPVLLVLGGVHGNEPGGWTAADDVASWRPAAGRLFVLPRANRQAISLFARTTEGLGDLNRLYPGRPDSDLPMERLANEIVSLARENSVAYVLDLHESWGFYAGRTENGTAFLGQTVTWGVGPANPAFGRSLVERANQQILLERDQLIERDGSRFRRSDGSSIDGDTPGTRGRSSLSLGGHVPGLTPILVEMGQQDQPLARRVELHLIVVRGALDLLGMA